MGDRHGRMRVHRWHVSLLRCATRHRSALAGGRLHLWLSAASGSVDRRLDEIAGKNFKRARVQRAGAATGRKTRGSAHMSMTRHVIPSEVEGSRLLIGFATKFFGFAQNDRAL